MPETYDIDRAFEALAQDVMDRTAPPSAFAAIKQARRRRRTAIATVALAAAVVVGGVAVPTLAGGDDSGGNVATEGLRALPAPAPFAPEGWELLDGSGPVKPAIKCLKPSSSPRGAVATGQQVLARGEELLSTTFFDFGDDAASADDAVATATGSSNGCGSSTPTVAYPGGEVQYLRGPENGVTLTPELWVARLGNRVGFSITLNTEAASAGQRMMMGDSLMAALQFPDTWEPPASDPSSPESQSAFGSEVDAATVDEAFGDWFTDWRQARVDGGLPCAILGFPDPATGSGSMPGGGLSINEYIWTSADDATAARKSLMSDLSACNSTRWSIAPSGPSAWVATSDAGTLWIAELGASIGLFEVRDGGNPPAQVKTDVAALLTDLLEASDQ